MGRHKSENRRHLFKMQSHTLLRKYFKKPTDVLALRGGEVICHVLQQIHSSQSSFKTEAWTNLARCSPFQFIHFRNIKVHLSPLILYSKTDLFPPPLFSQICVGVENKPVDTGDDGNYASYLFCEHWYFDPSKNHPFSLSYISLDHAAVASE